MKKVGLISLLLIMLLISSGFSGCIGQQKSAEDNNTSTLSYSDTQSGRPSLLSMMFWSSLWHRHVAPNIHAAKSYLNPDSSKRTDISNLNKNIDAKNPTETAEKIGKNSLIYDTGSKSKPKDIITSSMKIKTYKASIKFITTTDNYTYTPSTKTVNTMANTNIITITDN